MMRMRNKHVLICFIIGIEYDSAKININFVIWQAFDFQLDIVIKLYFKWFYYIISL